MYEVFFFNIFMGQGDGVGLGVEGGNCSNELYNPKTMGQGFLKAWWQENYKFKPQFPDQTCQVQIT